MRAKVSSVWEKNSTRHASKPRARFLFKKLPRRGYRVLSDKDELSRSFSYKCAGDEKWITGLFAAAAARRWLGKNNIFYVNRREASITQVRKIREYVVTELFPK